MTAERRHATRSVRPQLVLIPLLAGAAVSTALGVYGGLHEPTGRAITTLGFSGLINMKAWLTTFATLLALFQLGSALRMFGRIGHGPAPAWVPTAHRLSGTLAIILTLPVAFHCLWSLGYQTGYGAIDTRVITHSIAGTAFYGALVAKLLTLRIRRLPGWALPVFAGLTFALLVVIWLSSSLWFFRNFGFPEF